MKIVLVTGGFDPLHSGHIALLAEAAKLGDRLIVGLNSDAWLTRKKGQPFMKWHDRLEVIRNIKKVNGTVEFNDGDGTAKDAIHKVRLNYPGDTIIFANGGDRNQDNIPEMDIVDDNLEFVFGIGGSDKKNSSSWILNNWPGERVNRTWGEWRVLSQINNNVKVKELIVQPGLKLSMQRHNSRSEFWFVAQGNGCVHWKFGSTELKEFDTIDINEHEWHCLENTGTIPLHVVEIQHGNRCDESDIERV